MPDAYELSNLDSHSFEHMVNFLALKVLGRGVTGFAQGADGGRDGFLVGEAPYPTEVNRWSGTWYIQSKFHKPHLSKNPQAWLINEVKKEIEAFKESEDRVAPDVWIIATNIEPSGNPKTGCFDTINKLVSDYFEEDIKFDIWGGRKILDFLADDPNAASYYGHFLTPGNVLAAIYNQVGDSFAQVKTVINHLILDQFGDQIYTKLEQAGSIGVRPKIHELFVDLPAQCCFFENEFNIMETLVSSSANVHRPTVWNSFGDGWRDWAIVPKRARVILLKGGPGQGKSTAGQYFAQVQRAALLLESDAPTVMPEILETAREFLLAAELFDFKPINPRIPISVELKDFAAWYGTRQKSESRGVISYLCEKITQKIDQKVEGGTLKRAMSLRSWFINFDGLDEVPNDVKDEVAGEITRFANIILPELDSDVLILCTTRPQGYSGQFESLNSAILELAPLPPEVAMNCAEGVIKFGRSDSESKNSMQVLVAAMESPQVRELMTTPLQSHIMAVVVRDGGRPPEKRWELFDNFYQVMKKRESLKNFPDIRISRLLRENSTLLKAIHARLGITLHASAEISKGADTTLERERFCELARQTTERYVEENVDDLVETLMEATVERLVFVNTPESNTTLRFDIRQLQEFFAGEFIYSNVDPLKLRARLEVIGGDSHWREVMHFVVSALIVNMRPTELAVALEVICSIDDSDISHYARTLKRRMGVGAILALRILAEGVLEQDKVVRLKFKEAIIPLYAMVDNGVTNDIAAITHQNTLAWLMNCMIDALFEYSEPEQIGAAIALSLRLPDIHSRSLEVKNKIFGSSPGYIDKIFRTYLSRYYTAHRGMRELEPSNWFMEGAIQLLTDKVPKDVDFSTILRFIRRSKDSIAKLGSFGFHDIDVKLLTLLLEPEENHKNFKGASKKLNTLTVTCHTHNWTTKSLPENFDIDIGLLVRGSHVLDLLAGIIKYVRSQSVADLREVISILSNHKSGGDFLPPHIQALVPLRFDGESILYQLKYFENMSQQEFEVLLDAKFIGDYKLPPIYSVAEVSSTDGWDRIKEISEFHPDIALSIWMQTFHYKWDGVDLDATQDHKNFIRDLVRNNAKAMMYHFTAWGGLFEYFPEYASEFRSLFLRFSQDKDVHVERFITKPFIISLPVEMDFLPLLARATASAGRRGVFDYEEITSVRSMLESYGLNNQILENIYMDEKNSTVNRAAAFSCYISQAADEDSHLVDDFFKGGLDELALFFSKEPLPMWYVNCLASSLEFFDHNEIKVIEFAGKVVYNYRADYNARALLQVTLSKWRERSSAPVQSRNILESWLGE